MERVDSAAHRIEILLRKVRDGGTGQFEAFYGASGSGKTTFLNTLAKFFEGVVPIPLAKDETSLQEVADRIRADATRHADRLRIYFFRDRDNDRLSNQEVEDFFEDLRVVFRENAGNVVVIWPVTREATAHQLAEVAWRVGADSVAAIDTRGLYIFEGLPADAYIRVADLTVKSLNGDSLESFGVSAQEATSLSHDFEAIGTFYSALEALASAKRDEIWSVLKERVRPRVWILVGGDDAGYLEGVVAGLTQGRSSRVDLELVLDFLDDLDNESLYLQKWRSRRKNVGYILRTLDVRVFDLPPNVGLAAVRGFGEPELQNLLKKTKDNAKNCAETVQKSRVCKTLAEALGGPSEAYTKGRTPSDETKDEYKRVQATARSDDKPLNKALASALQEALSQNGLTATIVAEKRDLVGVSIQPDVQVWVNNAEVICLEPTWRTSGTGVAGEIDKSQNSMTKGNIQKYLLNKVLDYVEALGL